MSDLDYTKPYYRSGKPFHIVGEGKIYLGGYMIEIVEIRECMKTKSEANAQKMNRQFFFLSDFREMFTPSSDPNDPAIHAIYFDNP